MSGGLLLLFLAITIAIILILILRLKMNAAIAMFIGACFMGFASNVGFMQTIGAISTGFGNTMKGIGLSVGFGIMLGQIVADTGAVQTIANKMLKMFGDKKSDYSMGSTGFIVSIPVFYDVGYVILMPIAKLLAKKSTQKTLPNFVGALTAGLGIAHTFIPPTPGPLTGGQLMGVPVGTTILAGIAIGLPTFLISMTIYNQVFVKNPKFWDPATCEEHDPIAEAELAAREKELIKDEKNLPSFGLSMMPIFLPVILILIGTVWGAVVGKNAEGVSLVPNFVQMISSKEVAMFFGILASFLLCPGRLSLKQIDKSMTVAMSAAGTVLLITGMGGALGNVLAVAGIGDALKAILLTMSIPAILFAWFIAALLKVAQGSGTVSMITSLGIIAAMGDLGVAPIFLAMAAFSGSLFGAHVNDSAFWITSKISGLSTLGGLKTYTLVCAIQSIVSLVFIFAASLIF